MRLLLLLLAGCSSPVTEALVTVSASGLQVGVDINRLHLSATDTTAGFSGFDQTLLLCPDSGAKLPGCRALPLSVVLYPGPKSPEDGVRVLVEGLRDVTVVLSSVAQLTFTPGVRQRLDFVLYGTCLNRLDCSGSDTVCDANGMCTHLMPTPIDAPDLSPVEDLSMPGQSDLAGPPGSPDFGGSDGAAPACGDLDQACCAMAKCHDARLACYNGTCQACGTQDAWCCPDGNALCGSLFGCDDTFHCVDCGQPGQPCCAGSMCAGSICSQGICQAAGCGLSSQPCCANGQCHTGVACIAGTCMDVACNAGSPCCAPAYCGSGNLCDNGSCFACGEYMQEACFGNPGCSPPFQADPFAAVCQLCDFAGYPCCGSGSGVCSGGLSSGPDGKCA